ncbi:MAG: hypothetical protein B6D62_00730 [Candidatus Cloacimonas sp. 4484_275]|nr:MAG: hypothetical protein B6D62_00730 [Candidatus Cloacimonas sp. 4484_275]
MKKLSLIVSTLFGTGYFPKAPGTAGTIVAALFYYFFLMKFISSFASELIFTAILIFSGIISVIFVSEAEKILGHDNGKIVVDEFIGFLFALLFLPKTLMVIIIAFILFRIFDIFKPEPVNVLQKLSGGWGVLADDVMAGIYANFSLQILIRIFPKFFTLLNGNS